MRRRRALVSSSAVHEFVSFSGAIHERRGLA
jgi:hypothetical protein